MSHLPHDLRELYGLRERLREQFQSGKGNKLELCLALVEIAQRITAIEEQGALAKKQSAS